MSAPRRRSFGRSQPFGDRWGLWVFPLVLLVTVGSALAAAANRPPLGVWVFVTVLGGWLVTVCLHEFGHAVTALGGGDTSVRGRGYLTLNPLRYSNAAMTFVVPLIILAVGGFPLPGGAVLIEHHRIRSAVWRSAVSAAGPLVNVALGALLVFVATQLANPLSFALAFLALLQFVVALLNLLPVPGLDGWAILAPFLPQRVVERVRPFAPWAPLALIVVLVSIPQAAQPLWDTSYLLFEAVGGSTRAASIGAELFRFWR